MSTLIAIAGTGTAIGKTAVTCAIATGARRAGLEVVGLKPLQTGTDDPSDADLLGRASGRPVAPLYSYPEPISPHLAARNHGATHSVSAVVGWVRQHAAGVTLVETAGGLFSPVSDTNCNADLVRACAPDLLVLVCAARLGVFHDVRATITAYRAVDAATTIVVVPSSPTSSSDADECARELRRTILPAIHEPARALPFGPSAEVDVDGLWAALRSP